MRVFEQTSERESTDMQNNMGPITLLRNATMYWNPIGELSVDMPTLSSATQEAVDLINWLLRQGKLLTRIDDAAVGKFVENFGKINT